MIKVKIGRHHIHRDINQPNPLELALEDNGFENIEVEVYFNIIPPNHDWGLWINGTRYTMSHGLRDYIGNWYIEHGSRNKPAELLIDHKALTADIQNFRPLISRKQCPNLAKVEYNLWLANGKSGFWGFDFTQDAIT